MTPTGDYAVSPECVPCRWNFVEATSFLPGLGQAYNPGFSYGGCGCLTPPVYTPVCFQQTALIPNYVSCGSCYPPTELCGGCPPPIYNWGPPIGWLGRHTGYPALRKLPPSSIPPTSPIFIIAFRLNTSTTRIRIGRTLIPVTIKTPRTGVNQSRCIPRRRRLIWAIPIPPRSLRV